MCHQKYIWTLSVSILSGEFIKLSLLSTKMQFIHQSYQSRALIPRYPWCLSPFRLLPKCHSLQTKQLSSSNSSSPVALSSVDSHPEDKSQHSLDVTHSSAPIIGLIYSNEFGSPHRKEPLPEDIIGPDDWDMFAMGELYCRNTKLPMAIYLSVCQGNHPMSMLVSQLYGYNHAWEQSEHLAPFSIFWIFQHSYGFSMDEL